MYAVTALSPRSSVPAFWPFWALLLLVAHGLLLLFLHARPGAIAVVPFLAGPPVLAALTAVTVILAGHDVLYGGWRRLVRLRLLFDALVLAASIFILLFAYRTYPSSHDTTVVGPCLAVPLAGDVAVLHGGRTVDVNRHAGSPSRRYAYDLAVVRDDAVHEGTGDALDDYYTYAAPVLAPMAGVVVSTRDGVPDRQPSRSAWRPWFDVNGNYVVIEVDDGRYLLLSHLQPGSIRVRPGDDIAVGMPVAKAGNSGRSATPHLQLHVQDSPVTNGGEGVPVEFCDYDAIARGASWDTARHIDRGTPTGRGRPQVIRRAPTAP